MTESKYILLLNSLSFVSWCITWHTLFPHLFQNSTWIWALTQMLLNFLLSPVCLSTTKCRHFLKACSVHCLFILTQKSIRLQPAIPTGNKINLARNNCNHHLYNQQENHNSNLNWKVCGGKFAHDERVLICEQGFWVSFRTFHCFCRLAGGGKSYQWHWPAGQQFHFICSKGTTSHRNQMQHITNYMHLVGPKRTGTVPGVGCAPRKATQTPKSREPGQVLSFSTRRGHE